MSRAKLFANSDTQKPLDDNLRMCYRFIMTETGTSCHAKRINGAHTQALRALPRTHSRIPERKPHRSTLAVSDTGNRLTPQRRAARGPDSLRRWYNRSNQRMSTAIEGQRGSDGRVSASTAQGSIIYQDTAPRDPEIGSGKGLLQPRALLTIYLVQALVLFPPNMHYAHTSQWWSQKTVNPPIPAIWWHSIRLDIPLNIIRGY